MSSHATSGETSTGGDVDAARQSASGAGVSSGSGTVPTTSGDRTGRMFEVNVRCIDGTTTTLNVRSDMTGAQLKSLLLEKMGVPTNQQRLIFRGCVVKDEDLVGQHITEDGQTLHMVQRPPPSEAQASSTGASGPDDMRAQTSGPQVHFQFTTAEGGAPQLGLPQVDLSQILGTVFGAVSHSAGGIGAVVHTGPVRTTTARGSEGGRVGDANVGGIAGPSASAASTTGTQNLPHQRSEATSESSMEPPQNQPNSVAAGGTGTATGQPAGASAAATQAEQSTRQTAGGAQANAVALHPVQFIFQQGLGNMAHIIPTVFGDALQNAETAMNAQRRPATETQRTRQGNQVGNAGEGGDVLPWRDLRHLNTHLNRLLGRPSQGRVLPPVSIPHGELHAFLAALLSTTVQLGVAISDLQASLIEGTRPQPRYRLQFAMALVSAARTLRGMATAMQSGGWERGFTETGATPSGAGTQQDVTATEVGTGQTEDVTAPGGSSDSEEEVTGDDGTGIEQPPGQPEDEVLDVVAFLEPSAGDAVGGALAGAVLGAADVAGVPTDSQSDEGGVGTSVVEAAQVMRALPQLFGPLSLNPGGFEGEIPFNVSPAPDAVQPPFSDAYLSGDTTGHYHAPVFPPPVEFLPLRWRRTAGRCEGLQEVPGPPEHLSRAYLCAFLRDLGQSIGNNSTFNTVPDAAQRYPHLGRLAAMFGQRSGDANMHTT